MTVVLPLAGTAYAGPQAPRVEKHPAEALGTYTPFWTAAESEPAGCSVSMTSGYDLSGTIDQSQIGCAWNSSGIVNGVWLHNASSVSYAFTIPTGDLYDVTYGIPEGDYLNNVDVLSEVDGGPTTEITKDEGGVGSTASKNLDLWESGWLSPGFHVLDFISTGDSMNFYGLWVKTISSNVVLPTWSGYVDGGATFTSVSGNWTVPSLSNCPATGGPQSVQWIGIDGGQSLEQIGTWTSCNPAHVLASCGPANCAFLEIWCPGAALPPFGTCAEPNGGLPIWITTGTVDKVHPGDAMSASVVFANNNVNLSISDHTKPKWTYNTSYPLSQLSPVPAQATAEWIVENPSGSTGLADFGSVSFTNAEATDSEGDRGGINTFSYSRLVIENPVNDDKLVSVSGLGAFGESFTDTWKASS